MSIFPCEPWHLRRDPFFVGISARILAVKNQLAQERAACMPACASVLGWAFARACARTCASFLAFVSLCWFVCVSGRRSFADVLLALEGVPCLLDLKSKPIENQPVPRVPFVKRTLRGDRLFKSDAKESPKRSFATTDVRRGASPATAVGPTGLRNSHGKFLNRRNQSDLQSTHILHLGAR